MKNQSTLINSLDSFVSREEIQDYMCEGCNKRVDVNKRTLIASTPHVLFIHLQRFVFSMDTFQNEKLNTRLEFPEVLNLKPYSLKGMAEQENQVNFYLNQKELAQYMDMHDDMFIYKLVGVTIHSGSADGGHYYSLINTARGVNEHDPYEKEQDWLNVSQDSWREFNDEEVKFFSFKDLGTYAFGDEQLSSLGKGSGSGRSAYMLVYSRKLRTDVRQVNLEFETESSQPFSKVAKYVPSWLEQEVQKDNINFVIDKQVFAPQFFTLVSKILKEVSSNHVLTVSQHPREYWQWIDRLKAISLDIGHRVTFDLLARFQNKTNNKEIADSLCNVLVFTESHITYCSNNATSLLVNYIRKYYLEDGCKNFFDVCFTCSELSTRMQVVNVTQKLVDRAFDIYGNLLLSKHSEHPRTVELGSVVTELMGFLFNKLTDRECHKNWSRLENYFTLLFYIVSTNEFACAHVLRNFNFVVDICDVMLGQKSPKAAQEKERRIAMGGTVTVKFGPLIKCLKTLVCAMHTKQMLAEKVILKTHLQFAEKHNGPKRPIKEEIQISDEALEYLSNPDLFSAVLQHGYQEEEFGTALAHVCY